MYITVLCIGELLRVHREPLLASIKFTRTRRSRAQGGKDRRWTTTTTTMCLYMCAMHRAKCVAGGNREEAEDATRISGLWGMYPPSMVAEVAIRVCERSRRLPLGLRTERNGTKRPALRAAALLGASEHVAPRSNGRAEEYEAAYGEQ